MAGTLLATEAEAMDAQQKADALQAAAELIARIARTPNGQQVGWETVATAQALLEALGLEQLDTCANSVKIARSLLK